MENINKPLKNEQKSIVDFEGSELLIRGIAGSGKTLVMLRKAKLTAEKYPEDKVAVFTYGKTLTNASSFLMSDYQIRNLTIQTFHSWAMRAYKKVFKKSKLYMVDWKDDFLKDALFEMDHLNHRFIKEKDVYKEFLEDEIAWIKGKGINNIEEYLKVNRRGRGGEVRVTKEDRKIIFKIFEEYNKIKDYKLDFDDLGLELFKHIEKIPEELKFDHIFVDEAQDLQQVQLTILKRIARKSFFVAADKGQKIYKTSFSWKDIGFNILGGRTKTLNESFRSTKEIIELASNLQLKDSIINDEEFTPAKLPEKSGPKPLLVKCSSKSVQDEEITRVIDNIQKKFPTSTIGLLARNKKKLRRIEQSLSTDGLTYEFVDRKNGSPYSPGVKLCTLHSSKGLEFDYVIIFDLNEPRLDDTRDMDEYWEVERRLLYVGMTRATTYVQLYYTDEPLRLLKELDKELYEKAIV